MSESTDVVADASARCGIPRPLRAQTDLTLVITSIGTPP